MEGFLLIDKPGGMTSHDVIYRVRRLTGEKRVGHAGTLDPFATGLLIVGVSRAATREMEKLVGLDKEYEATFAFGAESDTDDRTGTISQTDSIELTEASVKEAIKNFIGEIDQIPPAYSAIKIGGQKMYEAARKGKPIEAKPRKVTVYEFAILRFAQDDNKIDVRIKCSSGTYIRALARDLGRALGTGGYVEELRRTKIGPYAIDEATRLDDLDPENVASNIQPIEPFLSHITQKENGA